jgi:hypothetical protein
MSGSRSVDGDLARTGRSVTLSLDQFVWQAIDEEARREGCTTEEMITFSVLYYLADLDSGRIARKISRSPYLRHPERPPGDTDRRSPARYTRATDQGQPPSGTER